MANIKVYAGLGGRLRKRLIDEDNVISVWPITETVADAQDIAFRRNPGVYSATGLTRGVTVDLPEGALGCAFDGTGYIQMPDDGEGYDPFNDPSVSGRNLSMSGGSFNVIFLIKTTTNDATLRAIAQKQDTNSSGNGWHIGLQNGAITVFARNSGTTFLNFSRGAVADGDWHLVHVYQDAVNHLCHVYIDGVQSGADEASVGAHDLAITTANFRIGMFTDGAGGFIGSLSYVCLTRNNDTTLSAQLQPTRLWTEITNDVRIGIEPIVLESGTRAQSPGNQVAGTGTCSFAMDNSINNAGGVLGYYSIGHANCRDGWTVGTPIKVEDDNWIKFRGGLRTTTPAPGVGRSEHVSCVATDWLDVAAIAPVTSVETLVEATAGETAGRLIDASDQPPVALSIATDGTTFPFSFDNSDGLNSVILQELTRVVNSENGGLVVRGDAVSGGVVTFFSRTTQDAEPGVSVSLDGTMTDIRAVAGAEALVNIVRVTVYPRRADAGTTTVLYEAEQRQRIPANSEIIISGNYRDPANEAVRVGAMDINSLVAGTDYSMNSASDGSGSSLNSDIEIIEASLGANSFEIRVKNNNLTTDGYFLLIQIRGRGLYTYAPIAIVERDEDSIRRYGPRELSLDMPFQEDTEVGRALALKVLNTFAEPRPIASSITAMPIQGTSLWDDLWQLEPGDRVAVGEDMTALSADDSGFVTSLRTVIGPATDELTVTFDMVPATIAWILEEVGFSELDETTTLAFG